MNKTLAAALLAVLCLSGLWSCTDAKTESPDDLTEARSALGKRNFLEAEKAFERYLRRDPDGAERWYVWQNLVEIALNVRNDRKGAIELLEAMLIEYDDNPEKRRNVRTRLAEHHRLSRNYERALTMWGAVADDATASSLEKAEAYRNIGGVYLRRLEFELSKEALGFCLTMRIPEHVRGQCLYDLAQTYMGMEEPENAINQLRGVLELQEIPDSLRSLTVFMLADALDQEGNSAEALKLFESIRTAYPNPRVVEKRITALRQPKKKPPTAPPPPASSSRR